MKKTQKTKPILFFTKKSSRAFFLIPLGLIFFISFGLLIATSWYSFDYQIAEVLAKGLGSEISKYWTRFYNQLGHTELFVFLIIYLVILLESLFLVKIAQKKNGWKKNYWVVNMFYILFIIAWVSANIVQITSAVIQDKGFGRGIDYALLDSNKYLITGTSVAFCYQSIILAIGLYYVRYHLVKTKQILINQDWIKAVKAVSFLAITYIIIMILKGTTARLYYFNVIFGDLFDQLPKDLQDTYLNSGFHYGYNIGDDKGWIYNIPWEKQYPWWKPTWDLQKDFNMPRFKAPQDYAFPSGHINATYFTASGILLFLKNRNNEKIDWRIKLVFVIWLLHILSMNFALMVERLHWMSDMVFTFVFSTLMIIIVHFTVNRILAKKIK